MNPSVRRRPAVFCVALLLPVLTGQCARAPSLLVHFRGTVPLDRTTTDQDGRKFTVTELSGLSWVGDTRFVAVMDGSDKLVFLDIEPAPDGTLRRAAITGGLTLPDFRDFEGIAYTGPARNSVFLCEEDTPAVREYALSDGALLQTPETPPVFSNRRHNFGFEALARHPDGTELWTANEEALSVDGALATSIRGTLVRLLRYRLEDERATPAGQFAYLTAPLHGEDFASGRSGLVELAVLPDGTVLALERSIALSIPHFIQSRLYELDFTDATDVIGLADGLIGESFTPVAKRLLWSGHVGNLEGLALGPPLAGGGRLLVGVVDDGDALSAHQLVAFEVVPPGASLLPDGGKAGG